MPEDAEDKGAQPGDVTIPVEPGQLKLEGQEIDIIIMAGWGAALTLFGVLFGVVATVIGVAIARWSLGYLIAYAVLSVVLLLRVPHLVRATRD